MSTFSPSPPAPSPSIIQSFILSIASIMGKPLVRTACLGLGTWEAAAAMKGYLHLNDCWWDGDGMMVWSSHTSSWELNTWTGTADEIDDQDSSERETNYCLFVVVAVAILSAVCQVYFCCWCCCPAVAGVVCTMFMFVIIVSTGLTIYNAQPHLTSRT